MESLAAVDLGSNSFHMVIARIDHGGVQIVDRIREPVRLAEGLEEGGRLSAASQKRAIACLELFGQRLRDFGAEQVRAVGTNTLRRVRDSHRVLHDMSEALGHHIEIITGREEARLIYLGVSHGIAGAPARRLVVDIGGGSTEFIIGDAFEPVSVHSMFMGCVGFTDQFFHDGKISRKRMNNAKIAAGLELQPVDAHLRQQGWERAIGASGTIRSIATILSEAGWAHGTITAEGLDMLEQAMLTAGRLDKLELPGLEADRRPVFAGGVAILSTVFERLGIDEMYVSPTALREGLLYDMLGRLQDEDPRDRTIAMLAKRYSIDQAHADRVQATALGLLGQVVDDWDLRSEDAAHALAWAAQLHEIGLAVNYTGHHKHGAYLVASSDLPGFARDEQALVAALIRGHRRKLDDLFFADLPEELQLTAKRLCALLRLAVLLNRNRDPEVVSLPHVSASGNRLKLTFNEEWLEAHPLARADLEREQRRVKPIGLRLTGFETE
ncbi:MAG: exopolyphosphatase [Deltaproteobacteria bacterium]|jgi:exopolyphosphatase/guanosine-5'-triphosphate,3'-diphosphate pyrophosphatase|nr:exopolyphosphatase [Deltaproteobacteria bacterium]